jgi:Icc-related predicted phosphoesterase
VEPLRLLAVADVHSPKYVSEFKSALSDLEPPDAFLFAGDMIFRGQVTEYIHVLDIVEQQLGTDFPIIACFGNEEYNEVRDDIIDLTEERMLFLDEKSTILELKGLEYGIVGTQGSLDKATTWQRRNIPSWKGVFERRAKRAAALLKKMEDEVDRTILLMHYSPCLETCEGEEDKAFSWLGSRKFYRVILEHQPDLVVHGHVHNSTRHAVQIGPTLVRNVAFPAVGAVTEIVLDE